MPKLFYVSFYINSLYIDEPYQLAFAAKPELPVHQLNARQSEWDDFHPIQGNSLQFTFAQSKSRIIYYVGQGGV